MCDSGFFSGIESKDLAFFLQFLYSVSVYMIWLFLRFFTILPIFLMYDLPFFPVYYQRRSCINTNWHQQQIFVLKLQKKRNHLFQGWCSQLNHQVPMHLSSIHNSNNVTVLATIALFIVFLFFIQFQQIHIWWWGKTCCMY